MTDRDSNKPLATSRRNFLKHSIAVAGTEFQFGSAVGGFFKLTEIVVVFQIRTTRQIARRGFKQCVQIHIHPHRPITQIGQRIIIKTSPLNAGKRKEYLESKENGLHFCRPPQACL